MQTITILIYMMHGHTYIKSVPNILLVTAYTAYLT